MRPVTWIHTADLHLDHPMKGWHDSKENGHIRREDYTKTFLRIISIVQQQKADFLLIAGDFLEHGFVQVSTVRFVKEQFRQIPGVKVLISPGNHDPYREDSFYYPRGDWPDNVHIFTGEWEELYFEEYDLTICGKGFSDYAESKWIPPTISRPKGRNLMIVHGTFFQNSAGSDECIYFPILERELISYPFDYVALGHIHKPFLATLDNGRRTRVCYSGSPEALNWKETGDRFVMYGCLDGDMMDVRRIPVHTRSYEHITVPVADCESREDIFRQLIHGLKSYDNHHCFRIVLTGRYSSQIDLNAEMLWLKEQVSTLNLFYFDLLNEARPDFDLSFYRKQKGVRGAFVREIEDRMIRYPDQRKEYELALFQGLEMMTRGNHAD